MFDDSPADDNDRPYDALDANDSDGDDDTFAVSDGYIRRDVHGRILGKGWTE